ncbi:MAG TPA: YihY/virulence factor BrkB family protein [Trebonia sp.]|nr:YihY/virulence factor BrkB family protein [Trebonia sp.]
MWAIDKPLRAVDRLQQRHPVLAFPVGVWSKFTEDQAGNLAALIAYYAFAATFPLLLILVTVLNIVLRDNPGLQEELIKSALAQYPVIGTHIKANLGTIPGTGLPLIIGIVFLLLGARGVAGAMQNAMCVVWGIPKERRPGFPLSVAWSLALVFSIGIGFVATTFLSGLAGGAGHVLTGWGVSVATVATSLVLNLGMFWLGFRLATFFQVRWRDLRTGAAIAAVCWQVLQVAGGYVVSHQLQRASELYGTFGIVLGLMAWLFLQSEVTLFAAEVDVVLARRKWPVSILPATMTEPAEAEPAVEPAPAAASSAEPAASSAEPAAAAQPARPAEAGPSAEQEQPAIPVQRGHAEGPRPVAHNGAEGWISRARRAVGRR